MSNDDQQDRLKVAEAAIKYWRSMWKERTTQRDRFRRVLEDVHRISDNPRFLISAPTFIAHIKKISARALKRNAVPKRRKL